MAAADNDEAFFVLVVVAVVVAIVVVVVVVVADGEEEDSFVVLVVFVLGMLPRAEARAILPEESRGVPRTTCSILPDVSVALLPILFVRSIFMFVVRRFVASFVRCVLAYYCITKYLCHETALSVSVK